MFKDIDKKKNKKNALIGLILIIIPIFLYITNTTVSIPIKEEVREIIIEDSLKSNNIKEDGLIKEVLNYLNISHGNYLVLSKDGTPIKIKVTIELVNNKNYIVLFRDSTIEFNGHLYDINPEKYDEVLNYVKRLLK